MRGEIRSLTGLRGIAACYVVLYHYYCHDKSAGPVGVAFRHGYLAVDLFFVLSGFVMTMTYGDRFAGGFKLHIFLDFIYKRLGRTYPLFIFATLAIIFIDILQGEPLKWWPGEWLANFFLLSGWGFFPTFVWPGWSVSAEFAAYLLFPGLILLARRSNRVWPWLLAALCFGSLFWIASKSDLELHIPAERGGIPRGPLNIFHDGTLFPLVRCLAEFILGILTFSLANIRLSSIAVGSWFTDLIGGSCLVLLFFAASDIIEVALFCLLIMGLATGTGISCRFLGSRIVHWLGTISYSIYLMQTLVFALAEQPIQHLLQHYNIPHAWLLGGLPILPLSIIIAVPTYYGIERPARDWSRRLAGVSTRRPIEAEPSAP